MTESWNRGDVTPKVAPLKLEKSEQSGLVLVLIKEEQFRYHPSQVGTIKKMFFVETCKSNRVSMFIDNFLEAPFK